MVFTNSCSLVTPRGSQRFKAFHVVFFIDPQKEKNTTKMSKDIVLSYISPPLKAPGKV